ncbi:unnamed protein product, partial [Nesidiocoris tenuis]
EGDITQLRVDAIVHSTNENFTERSFQSDSIIVRAGPDLKAELLGEIRGTIRKVLELQTARGGYLEKVVLVVESSDAGIYEILLPLYFPRNKKEESAALLQLPTGRTYGLYGEPVHPERQIRIIDNPHVINVVNRIKYSNRLYGNLILLGVKFTGCPSVGVKLNYRTTYYCNLDQIYLDHVYHLSQKGGLDNFDIAYFWYLPEKNWKEGQLHRKFCEDVTCGAISGLTKGSTLVLKHPIEVTSVGFRFSLELSIGNLSRCHRPSHSLGRVGRRGGGGGGHIRDRRPPGAFSHLADREVNYLIPICSAGGESDLCVFLVPDSKSGRRNVEIYGEFFPDFRIF